LLSILWQSRSLRFFARGQRKINVLKRIHGFNEVCSAIACKRARLFAPWRQQGTKPSRWCGKAVLIKEQGPEKAYLELRRQGPAN